MESIGALLIVLAIVAALVLIIAWIALPLFVWQLTNEARKTTTVLEQIEANTRHVAMKLGK